MLVIVDEREMVTAGYACRFGNEGVSAARFRTDEFREWVATVSGSDLYAVEAFLLGDCRDREVLPKMIRERSRAPVIAMNEAPSLEQTSSLFAAGVDDVVRKPIHVREILARVGRSAAGLRLSRITPSSARCGSSSMAAIPRSRAIFCRCRGASGAFSNISSPIAAGGSSKSQIFNSIYGIFDDNVEENVVESHISKLRKKLRRHLGMRSDQFSALPRLSPGGRSIVQRAAYARPRCLSCVV